MNFLLNKISSDNTFSEYISSLVLDISSNSLSVVNDNGNISINYSLLDDAKIKQTNIFVSKDQVGIGRIPLYNYKLDIAVETDVISTGMHIGDGSYGFSLGNGSNDGFIPEIIGLGKDETDAGLYFLGRSGNDKESNVPLLIFDGRSMINGRLKNRPIMGITSGSYFNYEFLIDQEGRVGIGKNPEYLLDVNGVINCAEIKVGNIDLLNKIHILEREIENLKIKLGYDS